MKKNGPILFCGFNPSARAALEELTDECASRGITILSRNNVPDFPGVKHLSIDYLDIDNLRHKKVGLKNCSVCVVFAESRGGESSRTIDMHTVLTVYNIKTEHPNAHVIAEIQDQENMAIISDLFCEDVIYKEAIDYNLIVSCILHPHISPIIYDLLQVRGKKIKETSIAEIGLNGAEVTFRDVRLKGLDMDITFLGVISSQGNPELMPANDAVIPSDCRLVYIE